MATRQISTDIWNDDKFICMDLQTRFLWLYLLTCPQSKGCGIYKLDTRYVELETGLSKTEIEIALKSLCEMRVIAMSQDTNEISVLNYPIYNIRNFGKPIQDMLNKELSSIKDKDLLFASCTSLIEYVTCKLDPNKKELWRTILKEYLKYLTNMEGYNFLLSMYNDI